MKEKVFLSWNWVDQQVMTLGETIKESVSEYTYITGIPRGGLIPGAYLSHYLGIKYIPYNSAKEKHGICDNKRCGRAGRQGCHRGVRSA